MDIDSLDWASLSEDQIKKVEQKLHEAKELASNAHKRQFLNDVVKMAIDKGISWKKAQSLMVEYIPSNDTEAKKLGFKSKRRDEDNVTRYYARKVKNSVEI